MSALNAIVASDKWIISFIIGELAVLPLIATAALSKYLVSGRRK